MAENNESGMSLSSGERESNSNRGGSRSRGSNRSGKYSHLYNMIDAFIDQIEMPRNRSRALKYGVRAVGEFFLNEEENQRSRSSNSQSESNSSSSGRRSSGSSKSSGSGKMRRG